MVAASAVERKSAAGASNGANASAAMIVNASDVGVEMALVERIGDIPPTLRRSVRDGRRLLLLRKLLLIQRLEANRREMYRRKARPHDGIGERFADVREEDRRAVDRDDRLELLLRDPANREDARLRGFDEEERLVADLCRERHGQHAFVDVG